MRHLFAVFLPQRHKEGELLIDQSGQHNMSFQQTFWKFGKACWRAENALLSDISWRTRVCTNCAISTSVVRNRCKRSIILQNSQNQNQNYDTKNLSRSLSLRKIRRTSTTKSQTPLGLIVRDTIARSQAWILIKERWSNGELVKVKFSKFKFPETTK